MPKKLAVIDFGSKYTAFIHRSLEKLGFEFEKFEVTEENPDGQEIFEKILEDKAFGGLVREWMMKKVYSKLNEDVTNFKKS